MPRSFGEPIDEAVVKASKLDCKIVKKYIQLQQAYANEAAFQKCTSDHVGATLDNAVSKLDAAHDNLFITVVDPHTKRAPADGAKMDLKTAWDECNDRFSGLSDEYKTSKELVVKMLAIDAEFWAKGMGKGQASGPEKDRAKIMEEDVAGEEIKEIFGSVVERSRLKRAYHI